MKIVIVGGVAGGATTAARLRRLDEHAEITILERGDYVSYANCGLPYYIGNVIKERENLFVMTKERLENRLGIIVKTRHEVLSVDTKNKCVKVKDHSRGSEFDMSYDKLVLSPGAEPIRPPVAGINSPKIFTLRSVPDTDAIHSFIEKNRPRRALIVGGGFIGLEMAENLHHLGMQLTIVEMLDQVMAPVDFEIAAAVHQHLHAKGVALYLSDGVSSFADKDASVVATLSSGRSVEADIVILSIGVRPDTAFVKASGIACTERGAVIVNSFLQTSDPDVYAVGDAIAFENPITNEKMNTLLAGPANRQGRIAADNIACGNVRRYHGAINSAVAKIFDITVATTGMAEKFLKKSGIAAASNITHSGSHAGYYPGAFPMTLKIVFDRVSGKLFGAQAVGHDGVDKRIDVIAAIIGSGGTIYDLQEAELCYAPPYSSAKDPVNIAGYSAQNIIEKRVNAIHWRELASSDMSEIFLLDVRTPDECALGMIEGAVNIELDTLRNEISRVPKDKKTVIYCAVGLRGYFASRILMQRGYTNVYNLVGGYKTWESATGRYAGTDVFSSTQVGSDDSLTEKAASSAPAAPDICIDACGRQCPGPIIQLKKGIDSLVQGKILEIKATDPGFRKDVASWCNITGNRLISLDESAGVLSALVQKGTGSQVSTRGGGSGKTLIVFSDDFDRALASFVIANGAASTGKKVTMFFTFWGLNLLKSGKRVRVKKDIFGKMFGMMLPKSSKKLALSKFNMSGMGVAMMRHIMKKHNIDSLEDMLRAAAASGIEMIACQMSMDVMGVKKEELYDFVKIGGVAAYLEAAEDSNLNLFI